MMKPNIITMITTDMVPQNVVEDITDANEVDEMFVDDLTVDEESFDSDITEIVMRMMKVKPAQMTQST